MSRFLTSVTALSFYLFSFASANVAVKRWGPQLPSCTNFTPYVYAGCFTDFPNIGALVWKTDLDFNNMTVEACIDFCKGNDYRYAGLEYYGECFCGETVSGALVDDSNCGATCTGNSSEICGGDQYISIYQDPTFTPVNDSTVADYIPQGCYSEGVGGRALEYQQNINGSTITVEECLFTCKDNGFAFAGVEYASQCFCSVVLGNGTVPLDSSQCNMACNGDLSETCGGSGTLNLYIAADLESSEPCGYNTTSSSSSSSSYSSAPPSSTPPSSTPPTSTSPSSTPPSSTSLTSSSTTWTSPTSTFPSSTTSSSPSSSSTIPSSTSPSSTSPSSTSPGSTSPSSTSPSSTSPSSTSPSSTTSTTSTLQPPSSTNSTSQPPSSTTSTSKPPSSTPSSSTKCSTTSSTSTSKPASSTTTSKSTSTSPCTSSLITSKSSSTSTSPCTSSSTTSKSSSKSSSTPTSTSCVPIPTQVCLCTQPSDVAKGYTSTSPVGSISLPCLTCNNLQADYNAGNWFKLYTSSDSPSCPSYPSPSVPQGCKDACDSQQTVCLNTYAEGCKSNSAYEIAYLGYDSYSSACTKCANQWIDCYKANSGASPGTRCSSWNTGWS